MITRHETQEIALAAYRTGDGASVRASLAMAGAELETDPGYYGPPAGAETLAVVRAPHGLPGLLWIVRGLPTTRGVWVLEAAPASTHWALGK